MNYPPPWILVAKKNKQTIGSSKKRLECMHDFLPFYLLDYQFSVLYIIYTSFWNLCSYLGKIDVEQKMIIQITGGVTYTGPIISEI